MSFSHTFQHYCDLSTKAGAVTLITVYAGGHNVFDRSVPFWNAFKYFKLGPVNIKLVPASTLPVDPTGLSYAAGEQGVDPRDMLTPGLVRITNGEDFWPNINEEGIGEDARHAIYNAMTLDSRWFKWNLQSGISKSATPRFWVIGQTRQDYYPGSIINVPCAAGNSEPKDWRGTSAERLYDPYLADPTIAQETARQFSSDRGLIQTGMHGELGWMPTDALVNLDVHGDSKDDDSEVYPTINNIPHVELFRILLPPAYKTKFYYRMFVTETVYFKEIVDQPPIWFDGVTPKRYAPLDRFIRDYGTKAMMPTHYDSITYPTKPATPNNLQDNHPEIQWNIPPETPTEGTE